MSWVTAANVLVKMLEIKGAYGEVKTVHDYTKKMAKADPTKLTWDDVKMFDTPVMNKALTGAKSEQVKASAAEKASFKMPEAGSLAAWLAAAKMLAAHGKDSKQFKDAMKKYIAILKAFDKTLDALAKEVGVVTVEMVDRKTKAPVLAQYAKILEKAFLNCAKVPMGGGQQATFFVLSVDCGKYAAILKTLTKSYSAVFTQSRTHSRAIADIKKTNLDWIKHAEKDVFSDETVMSKNTKAVKPKK